MNILVTGGQGFIGKHLVEALCDDGHDVRIVDLMSGNDVAAYNSHHRFDQVYHLASPVGPVGLLSKSGNIALDIIAGLHNMLLSQTRWGARILYVSSSEVYGPKVGPEEGFPLDEEMTCVSPGGYSPRLEYALAKLCGEVMAQNFAQRYGADLRIVRLFNTIGVGQDSSKGFVVARFMEQARAGEPLTVYHDGMQIRSFTDVRDTVSAMRFVMACGKPSEIYNVGNPANVISIQDLARQVLEVTGSKSRIEHVDPQKLHGPTFREAWNKVPNVDKLTRLGWKASHSLRTTLEWISSEL